MTYIARRDTAQEAWPNAVVPLADNPAMSRAKRGLDIAFSVAALLFLLPLLILVAAAVRFTSPGPVLFRQRRTGLNGQPFQILKFRSMTVMEDGENIRHATRDDKRVTKVGAFLRRSSLDELPQLFNILKGDMSLVGPRPHALTHDVKYGALIPEYVERFGTRPGLTGLAQVAGLRGEIVQLDCMRNRVAADIQYITTWSLRSDITIILRTFPLVFSDSKAF